MGKKKKLPRIEKGTILLLSESFSEENLRKMREYFANRLRQFDFVAVLNAHKTIPAEETYLGPCQWCGEEIYTRDVCPECGKMVDIS